MNEIFESSKGKIYYSFKSKGAEKNLLLIHGFMEDHEVWNELAESIEANIIRIDLLGFGKSIPNTSFDFSMQQHALSIHELLEFLMPDPIYVLGHSMGGYIAIELSILDPNIHIGLLHSTCVADTEERKANRNKTIEVLEKDPSIFIREFYWNLFAEHHKNEFAAEIEILKQKAEKMPAEYIIKTVRALRDRKEHSATWKLSGGNNIIIGGTYDKLLNVEELEELAFLGGSQWAEMTNSGHMAFYEEPEGLNEIVKLWMELE